MSSATVNCVEKQPTIQPSIKRLDAYVIDHVLGGSAARIVDLNGKRIPEAFWIGVEEWRSRYIWSEVYESTLNRFEGVSVNLVPIPSAQSIGKKKR